MAISDSLSPLQAQASKLEFLVAFDVDLVGFDLIVVVTLIK